MVIKESFLLVATDADILAAPSRLAAIPSAGMMTIEASSTDCDATNFGTLTLQLPGGDTPFEDLHIPAAGIRQTGVSDADAVLNTHTELMISFNVAAGGHVGLAYTENGTVTTCIIMVTLTF